MGDYTVTFARSARKELESLSASWVARIFPKIEALAKEPRPSGVRKLQAEDDLWRIRVGEYRIVYVIDDRRQNVDIIAVRHRSAAYK